MQVLTNTDRNVAGSAGLSAQVGATVTALLGRFSQQVTRMQLHLSVKKGPRGGRLSRVLAEDCVPPERERLPSFASP